MISKNYSGHSIIMGEEGKAEGKCESWEGTERKEKRM
jgi:hypothetical protein